MRNIKKRRMSDNVFWGSVKPAGLNLECSCRFDNVEFSFQDTSATPLANCNISVYDNIDGTKIEGLEIEMFYNGVRLNVHKLREAVTIYKTNTGAHDSTKTNPSDLDFNGQSQASSARASFSAAISNVTAYLIPARQSGKNNMFVTYH